MENIVAGASRAVDTGAANGFMEPHMLCDQTIHPGINIQQMSYSHYDGHEEQLPCQPNTPSLPATFAYESTLHDGSIPAHPTTATAVEDSHAWEDTQQQQLPEAAPAPKTDPLELSLLASYLEVVRQTQGDAAAAEAMAASGADAAAIDNALSNSPRTHQGAQSAADSQTVGSANLSNVAGAAAPRAAASGVSAAEDDLAIDNLLGFIKQYKLTGLSGAAICRRSSSGAASTASSTSATTAAAQHAPGHAVRKVWIQPSGPRRPGEGVENEEQGILSAEEVPATGEVMMRITLLAAGFVIGPSGASVREIVRLTGADVNSWTESAGTHRGRRPARIFVIKGEPRSVAQAMYIITAAVDRYKELCEGRYTGQSVPRSQNVLGVTFSYQPPPKSVVPYAASLKELYAPMSSTAAHSRYGCPSPSGLFPDLRMHSNQGFHGVTNPYDPISWSAMMTAAAQMGMNPFAALAATGYPAAATLGFNPYNLLAYNPPVSLFNRAAGFGSAPHLMAGLNPARLDSMPDHLGGFAFNPNAAGMAPFMNPDTSAALINTGDMFGGGASLLGGGGLGMDISRAHGLDEGTAAHAGYNSMWGGTLGSTAVTGLFDAGVPNMSTAGALDPGNATGVDTGAAYDPALAMAAMQWEATTAPMASNPDAAPFSTALPATIGAGNSTYAGGTSIGQVDRAAPSLMMSPHSSMTDAAINNMGNHQGLAASAADGAHHALAPAGSSAWPVGSTASVTTAQTTRLPLSSMQAPASFPHISSSDVTTPRSPPANSAYTGHPGANEHRSGLPPQGPPHSPHLLGTYAALFPPLSPAGHMITYPPVPGMPAFAAASPVRVMHDKSGLPVPYVELGGTTYFPASPMPPPAAVVHLPQAHQLPQFSELCINGRNAQQEGATVADASHFAGDQADTNRSGGRHGGGISGGQRHHHDVHVGSGGRPLSHCTAMQVSGPTLQLLEDNPYLVQDTIGSNKSPHSNQQPGRYNGSGSSSSGGGSGGRHYTRSSPRHSYLLSPRQPGKWQVKRVAGSTNSVSTAGFAAAADNSDVPAQREADSGHHENAARHFSDRDVPPSSYRAGNVSSQKSPDKSSRGRILRSCMRDDQIFGLNVQREPGVAGTNSKPGLGVIPESDVAAVCSPPRRAGGGGGQNRGAGYGQLGAQDPIVSPGRITLASKFKSARFSAAAHAAATGKSSPGIQ